MNEIMYKCPCCNCVFSTRIDLEYHKKTHIKKTRNGKGEIFPIELYPRLIPILMERKPLKIGQYNYVLLKDNKTVYRWKD